MNPLADIDEGLVLAHPLGIIIIGKVGKNATFFARGGVGGGLSKKDIGAGPGLPVVGDGVTFEINAVVLGPVRIGDNVRVRSVLVTSDIAEGMEVQLPKTVIKKSHVPEHASENEPTDRQK
jgi:serine O-acetyltransferase